MPKVDVPSEKLIIRAVGKDEPATFPNMGYEDEKGIMVQLGSAVYSSEVN